MGLCAYCLKKKPLTKEHLIPRRYGGKYVIKVCRACNEARGSSACYPAFIDYIFNHPVEWHEAKETASPSSSLDAFLKKVDKCLARLWSSYYFRF